MYFLWAVFIVVMSLVLFIPTYGMSLIAIFVLVDWGRVFYGVSYKDIHKK